MKKIYISGPITGTKDFEAKFSQAENFLKAQGLEAINPVTLSRNLEKTRNAATDSLPYGDYMKNDIRALLSCDAIVMLPGWMKSNGAKIELMIAKTLGFGVYWFDSVKQELLKLNALVKPQARLLGTIPIGKKK